MAIDFGTKSSDEADSQMDKALTNLSKFSAPIFEITAKEGWGGSSSSTETKPGDPIAGMKIRMMAEEHNANMMRHTPTTAETLLGGVQGALSGYSAGTSAAGALGAENKTVGGAVGAVVGSFMGGNAYASGNRISGMSTVSALDNIAKGAAEWEKATKVQIANDAVASFSQRMGEYSHPTNPKQAVEFAAAKDKIVSETAQALVASGVAPDKALQTAQAMAAIHDPTGRYSDAKTQAATALAEFYAGPQTAEDKAMLKNKLNTIIMGEAIRTGKMPANATSMLFGTGAGYAQPPSAPQGYAPQGARPTQQGAPMSVEQAPFEYPGAPLAPPAQPASGSGKTYAGSSPGPWAPNQPQSSGGGIAGAINKMLGPFGNPFSATGGATASAATPGPAATPSGGGAGAAPQSQPLVFPNPPSNSAESKQAFGAQNAWNVLDQAEAMIRGEQLPSGSIDALQASLSQKGLDLSAPGTAIGGVAGAALGGPAGGAAGAALGGTLGHSMGRVGQGASWGMSDDEEMALNQASQLRGQLQTYIGQMMGSSSAGRTEDMKEIINAALGAQGDSIQERLAAIQLLRTMVQDTANEIGAYSEEKEPSRGNIARVKTPQPGMFFFE